MKASKERIWKCTDPQKAGDVWLDILWDMLTTLADFNLFKEHYSRIACNVNILTWWTVSIPVQHLSSLLLHLSRGEFLTNNGLQEPAALLTSCFTVREREVLTKHIHRLFCHIYYNINFFIFFFEWFSVNAGGSEITEHIFQESLR